MNLLKLCSILIIIIPLSLISVLFILYWKSFLIPWGLFVLIFLLLWFDPQSHKAS